jgi:hypothetical protein
MVRVTELGARLRTQVVTREISATHRLHWNKIAVAAPFPRLLRPGQAVVVEARQHPTPSSGRETGYRRGKG